MVFFSFLSRFGGYRVVSLTYPRADRGGKTGCQRFGEDGLGRSLAAQEGARPEGRREKSAALLQFGRPRRRGQKGRTAGDVEHDPVTCSVFLRHLHESSPSSDAGGGLFFDFEPFRTTSGPSSRRGGESAVAAMASSRPRRRDGVSATARRRDAVDAITRESTRHRRDAPRYRHNAGPSCAARR